MTTATTTSKVTFGRRAWYVPNEHYAFAGWLEGRPTAMQRDAVISRARQRRATWQPGPEAWDQLIQLQRLVGRRVRIQFWDDGSMWLLAEDEWPAPVDAQCEGVATMIDDGHLQAFLLIRDAVNARTGEPTTSSYLIQRAAINGKLAPLAHLYEVEVRD